MIATPIAGTSQKMAIAARTMLRMRREGRNRERRFCGVPTTGNEAACTALIL